MLASKYVSQNYFLYQSVLKDRLKLECVTSHSGQTERVQRNIRKKIKPVCRGSGEWAIQ